MFSLGLTESSTERFRAAQLASIRQMSRQVSRGSAGENQADEPAGVARLSWRGLHGTVYGKADEHRVPLASSLVQDITWISHL